MDVLFVSVAEEGERGREGADEVEEDEDAELVEEVEEMEEVDSVFFLDSVSCSVVSAGCVGVGGWAGVLWNEGYSLSIPLKSPLTCAPRRSCFDTA